MRLAGLDLDFLGVGEGEILISWIPRIFDSDSSDMVSMPMGVGEGVGLLVGVEVGVGEREGVEVGRLVGVGASVDWGELIEIVLTELRHNGFS